MRSSPDTDLSRTQTDDSLRAERGRSDDELLARSHALAEDTEELVRQARDRARAVLELARKRADEHLRDIDASDELEATVHAERDVADATLTREHAAADLDRLDERERRRVAIQQLLADERALTDQMLHAERERVDRRVDAREDLLAAVAHDLRTLLNTVLVNASVIRIAPDIATAAPAATGIHRAGTQMAHLIDNLLDVATFDAGTVSLVYADVDLVQLAREAVALHDEVAKSRGIALGLHTTSDAVTVRADARRIMRVLVNLISNALKYTSRDGRVDVLVTRVSDGCELAVIDTGIGIPKDQLQRIFERFYRVRAAYHRTSGAGLGLYLCRRIVDAHGGQIWAESTPGVGTTVRVRLPAT